MQNTYIVTGTLTDDYTVKLDEPLKLTQTKVRLVVEPLSRPSRRSYPEVVNHIRKRQQKEVINLRLQKKWILI